MKRAARLSSPSSCQSLATRWTTITGALLVPRTDIHNEFVAHHIDLQRLARLKPIWKVAMQSLLYRASELGYVQRSQAGYLWRQLNYFRYKMREPVELDFPQERPV